MTAASAAKTAADGNEASPWQGRYAFVDLETTGGDPVRDRIIEIAIITVEDGEAIDEWSSLVAPETRVPATVVSLTGITAEALAGAPAFTAITEEIVERLRGRTLVAHNARFDYGFLRNSLRREGIAYQAPAICTLRLARDLYPRLQRHGLDALTQRFDVAVESRHRALDDIRATLALTQRLRDERGARAVADALARQRRATTTTRQVAETEPPPAPGVYFFYDARDTLLYVGKSGDLRTRMLQHFSGDHRSRRAAELAQRTARVDWHETVGELEALLREADYVKRLRPAYNRRLRASTRQVVVSLREDGDGYLRADIVAARAPDAWRGDHWYGPFSDRRAARRGLQRVADEHGCCARRLGLESGRGQRPCFARQLGRCHGACSGAEAPVRYNMRLLEALAKHRIRPWPWPGPVGVVERDPMHEREAVHVIDHWRYLGTARDTGGIEPLLAAGETAPFDRDHYRLLARWLTHHPDRVRPLTGRRDEASASDSKAT